MTRLKLVTFGRTVLACHGLRQEAGTNGLSSSGAKLGDC